MIDSKQGQILCPALGYVTIKERCMRFGVGDRSLRGMKKKVKRSVGGYEGKSYEEEEGERELEMRGTERKRQHQKWVFKLWEEEKFHCSVYTNQIRERKRTRGYRDPAKIADRGQE